MKDLGVAKNILGFEISRDRQQGKLWLDQTAYIKQLLNRFNMLDCNAVSTPVDKNQILTKDMCPQSDSEKLEMDKIPYQQAVGSLLYAAQGTRPDAVSLVSRYNNNPGTPHWNAVKRIFRYLKGTIDKKLQFQINDNPEIVGFSDADWAGNVDNRQSVTGYVFMGQGGAICWNSKKQQTVALSTTEAEYMALSATVQEAMWLRNFMRELDAKEAGPTIIYCDNKSAIDLASIANYKPRIKHKDVRHHFIRQHILNNEIIIRSVGTREMTADVLTKGLPRELHENCVTKMGVFK